MKRLIAILLCVLMAFGTLPQTIAIAAAGDTGVVGSMNPGEAAKIVDPSTMHDWKNFFGKDFVNTENAGGVWSDKSVFETAEEYKAAQAAGANIVGNAEYNALTVDKENFLVALSNIAANKEIVGYSALPTDTIFILDLSQSMDNSRYVPNMVNAANNAIKTLMELNLHNRIGVVLYSGNPVTGNSNLSHATVLLPLDRYTTGNAGTYISYTGSSDTTVSVSAGVKNSENRSVTGSKNTNGGTYIQAGLYLASQEFKKAYDDGSTVIESGLIQGGTKRLPIITLMSDGRPTAATTAYANVATSNQGNGSASSSNNTTTFLTQLTAKWLKDNVTNWYENDALFYTLWLKDANDNTANGTLEPSASNDTLDGWWKTFLNAQFGATVSFGSGNSSFSVTRDRVIERVPSVNPATPAYNAAWQAAQNYVDESFNASNAKDFEEAFEEIVETIILQSQYYPTLVEGGDYDTDGYVTVEDPIGEFMEVKEIKGLDIGGHLFTGSALIQMMINNDFGDRDTYTENGWLLLEAIQERIGVTEAEAIALAEDAWTYGQLGYNPATGKYSNYIGWYADANNNYLGFWHEGHTANDVPSGATQIMKSYGFYGVIDENISESNIEGEDMMHVAVRVATQIDDKDQTVTLGIPASLIPLINYSVEVNSNSLESATRATLEVSGAEHPVRLLFEVGLRDEINELTVDEIVGNSEHHHTDSEGNYVFFTNRWGQEDEEGGMIEFPDPTASTATVSHYNPSVQNERYYYIEDTIIYSDTNGTEYTGGTAPSGSGYYRIVYTFVGTGNGNNANIVKNYVEITAAALATAERDAEGRGWHIPQGTMRGDIAGFGFEKTENRTGTLPYSVHCDVPGYAEGRYEVYELHGNNGMLTLKQANGIEITKEIEVIVPGTSIEGFVLDIDFTAPEGTVLPETVKVSYDGKTYVEMDTDEVYVTLRAGQSVYVYGLPAGTAYTITERDHEDYSAAVPEVTGVVEEGKLIEVSFENVVQKPGSVVIRKVVEHPFGANTEGLEDVLFSFVAQILDENDDPAANIAVTTSKGDFTTDDEGKFSFTLTHGESISVNGLEEGYKVRVSEVNIPEGFTVDEEVKAVIVENDTVKEVVFTNTYDPENVPEEEINIEITGHKNLIGRDWLDTDSFTFQLLYWDGAHWVEVPGAEDDIIANENDTFDLTAALKGFEFDREGAFNFWVVETAGNIGGVTYDTTHRYFTVNVVDNWNGHYEIADVTEVDSRIDFTKTTGENLTEYKLDMDFTNTYAPAGSDDVEVTMRKKVASAETISDVSLAGYQFAIFDGENQVGSAYTTDGSGHAVIKLIYDASMLTPVYEDGVIVRYDDTVLNYTVREITPADEEKAPGVTYTEDYANLTITLSDNLDGTISATAVITPCEGAEDVVIEDGVIVFTNTYEPSETDIRFYGTKDIAGREMNEEDNFVFELYETGADFAVSGQPIDTAAVIDGAFEFDTIVYEDEDIATHYYVIKEQNAGQLINGVTYTTDEYRITVRVYDAGGALEKEVTVMYWNGTEEVESNEEEIAFENIYETVEHVIEVTKAWEGDNEAVRPDVSVLGTGIDFQLQYAVETEGAISWAEYTDAERTVVVNEDGTWSVKYTMVFDKGETVPQFRVVETIVPENYVVSDGGIAENGGTITNVYNLTDKVVTATKVWENDNEEIRPSVSDLGTLIDFELQYKGSDGSWTEYTDAERTVVVNSDGSWFVKYTMTVEVGDNTEFRIVETIVPEDYKVSYEGNVITNTYIYTEMELEAVKVWENDNEEIRPTVEDLGTKIDFRLEIKDEEGNWVEYTDYLSKEVAPDGDEWYVRYTVKVETDTEPEFRIVEIIVPENYTVSYDGNVITNTYKEEDPPVTPPSDPETQITVRKVWEDNNNKAGRRPENIEIQIYADDVKYGPRFILCDENNWSHTVRNLPMYDAEGDRVEYTAIEVNVPRNYSASYDYSFYKTVVITNIYGDEPGNPETGAPVFETAFVTVNTVPAILPKKDEEE